MDVREKLAEIMTNLDCNEEYCKDCKFCNDIDGCVHMQKEIIADRLIASGVTVQEWISVTERFPEENNDGSVNAVLVTDGFVQHMAYFARGEWRFAESGEIKEPMWYSITHWMPLPEPPKGE